MVSWHNMEFKAGDKVIANFYGRKLKCTVREVGVMRHLFKPDGLTWYRIDGEAESICTGHRLEHIEQRV